MTDIHDKDAQQALSRRAGLDERLLAVKFCDDIEKAGYKLSLGINAQAQSASRLKPAEKQDQAASAESDSEPGVLSPGEVNAAAGVLKEQIHEVERLQWILEQRGFPIPEAIANVLALLRQAAAVE